MQVLFLDFDGVLHPDGCAPEDSFCFADNFVSALRDADPTASIKIVLSTTWRFKYSMDVLKARFPTDVADRIVGVTPDFFFNPGKYSRQREVESWMSEHCPAGIWMAIDDKKDNFDEGCSRLFHVPRANGEHSGGLTEALALEFKQFLSASALNDWTDLPLNT